MLVHRVLVILVELQQSAGAVEIGDEAFQDAGAVQVVEDHAQPARMRQQRQEPAARLGRRFRGKLRRLPADEFPRGRRDRRVVEVRQLGQPHDLRQVAAKFLQAAAGGGDSGGPHAKPLLHAMAQHGGGQPGEPLPTHRLGHEPLDHVAHLVRVAEILAHELFHRQQPGDRLVAQGRGDPQLLAARQHVGGLAGVEVQLVAEPEEEFTRPLDRCKVFVAQCAAVAQFARIGRAVANESDPAEQLQVAQPAGGSLDVGLQQEDGFAVAGPLFEPRLHDRRHQVAGPPAHLAAEAPHEPLEKPLAAAKQPRLHQRGANGRIPGGQPARLPRRADAVAQDQSHVEDVAQQPFGQGGDPCGRRATVQDHQVHVAIGGDVAPAVAAVDDQGHLGEQALGAVLAQVGQRRTDQFHEHVVAEIGRTGRHTSTPEPSASWRRLKSSFPLASRALAASTLERSSDT